jgi:hypothetical protein
LVPRHGYSDRTSNTSDLRAYEAIGDMAYTAGSGHTSGTATATP